MAATDEIERAVLGVGRSIGGKRWRARLADERGALALAQQLELPEIVARVLAARGVDADGAAAFLNPTLRDQLPDPLHLLDMEAAVERILAALTGGEVIGVIPEHLMEREVGHQGVTALRVVGSMHERKELMFALSDACAILPGGLGTLDEALEVLTWKNSGCTTSRS